MTSVRLLEVVTVGSKYKVAASVVIKNAPNMTKQGKKDIREWLEHVLDMFITESHNFSDKKMTFRYLYKENNGY